MKERKVPLLKALNQQFDAYTKDQLTAFIVCRNVLVNGVLVADPKQLVQAEASFSFTFDRYVSRGGYKLEHALKAFALDVHELVVLDAGSSTGGFTDCLLQHGARMVHSVDVGHNQLDWRLRTNTQVMVHEKQNIMLVEQLEPACDLAVCDLSFRSITGAARHILDLTKKGLLVSLIKPQFEVPKGLQDFNGIVQDRQLLAKVMLDVFDQLAREDVGMYDLTKSPITGHKGNVEFLALLKRGLGLSRILVQSRLEALLI